MNKTVSSENDADDSLSESLDPAQETVASGEDMSGNTGVVGMAVQCAFSFLWNDVNVILPEDNSSLDVRDTGISREITQKYVVRIEVNSFLKIHDYRVATRKAFGNVTGWFWWNPDTCEELTNVTHWTPILFLPLNF